MKIVIRALKEGMGECGRGAGGQRPDENRKDRREKRRRLQKGLQTMAPADILLVCGDATHWGIVEECHVFVEQAAPVSCRVPVPAVLGNHDFESGKPRPANPWSCSSSRARAASKELLTGPLQVESSIANPEEQRMRRKERAIDRSEIDRILAEGIFGVLSLNGGDQYPYGVPMNYVYTENRILLHAALEGEKLDRIRKDNRVSFCVVGKATALPEKFSTDYSSVIVFGRANIIEGDEKLDVLLALVDKYSAEYKEQGKELALKTLPKVLCISIDIERVTGKVRK